MKYLITGGFGFLGTHLVERLLMDGHEVMIIDDLSSNPIPHDAFLSEIQQPSTLTYRTISVEDYYELADDDTVYDAIFHLASYVGPAGVLDHAGEIAHQIIADALDMACLALEWNCRLINVSTSEVYGGGQQGLCRETMPCIIQPRSNARLEYSIGKLAAEIALRNTEGLDHITIRPFNICGPRQSGKNGFVLPRLISQAFAGEPLTVFNGNAVRAMTDVRDIAHGLVLALEKGRSGEVYNLGAEDNRTTILDLAHKVLVEVERVTGKHNPGIRFIEGKAVFGEKWEDASDKFPDASKAMQELGWQPTRTLDEIIRDVIEYERSKEVAK